MTPKQDKQGVRTAAHIEQKYELGGFDKAIEAAANAQKTADGASTKAQNALNTAQRADETANAAATQATNTQASLETLSQTVATNTENIGKLDVRVQTLEKEGTGGGGGGDMSTSVYDPQGKAQDIFAYVDAAISGAIGGSY